MTSHGASVPVGGGQASSVMAQRSYQPKIYRVQSTWTGTTRPLDGVLEQAVTAGDTAVLSIRFPHDRRPIPPGTPFQYTLSELDRAIYDELRIPSGVLLGVDRDHGAMISAGGRAQISSDLSLDAARESFAAKRPGVYVVDAAVEQSRVGKVGPEPSEGVLNLYEQCVKGVEAAYGLVGLMGRATGQYRDQRVLETGSVTDVCHLGPDGRGGVRQEARPDRPLRPQGLDSGALLRTGTGACPAGQRGRDTGGCRRAPGRGDGGHGDMKAADVLAAVEQLGVNDGARPSDKKLVHNVRAEVIRMLRGPVRTLYQPHGRTDCLTLCAMGLRRNGKTREAEWLLQLSRLTDLLEQRPWAEHKAELEAQK